MMRPLMRRGLGGLPLWVLVGVFGALAWAAHAVEPLRGHLDAVTYDPIGRQVQVQGWAWDSAFGVPPASLHVAIDGQVLPVATLTRVDRPDVQAVLGSAVSRAGFSASFPLPPQIGKGTHDIQVTALWPHNVELRLPSTHACQVTVQAAVTPLRHWALLGLVATWILLAYLPRPRTWALQQGSRLVSCTRNIDVALMLAFLLMVACGITGSSWHLLTQGAEGALAHFVTDPFEVFSPRFIRSDEWGILTTNALAQWNHQPPFPVVNSHLGLEGQNMGVVGMTGTPIAQWAAVARPATWGYFFLPLRQAMAWHWAFPFFACLWVLWKGLRLLLPARAGFTFTLALGFCVAPYAAGWSLWPLYAVFFPMALFVALARLLQAQRWGVALLLGTCMGALLTGWVLVLYPPWQITVGTFIGLLALGWATDHRAYLHWGRQQWCALALMVAVAAALLTSWWLDTSDAVARMQATVYTPGGRTAQQGADIVGAPWWVLRGYLNTETLTFGVGANAQTFAPSLHINESELSAYFLLPLPIVLMGLWRLTQPASQRWALVSCMVFIAFWVVFRFIGVPLWLAQLTLWSHVTSVRLDLALGLASTVLLALLWPTLRDTHGASQGALLQFSRQRVAGSMVWGVGVALVSAGLVALEFHWIPSGLLRADTLPLRAAIALAIGYASWWVMRCRLRPAAGMLLLLSVVATLGFNPWTLAPRAVGLPPAVAELITEHGELQRTLVIGNDAKAAVTLVAAGAPVVNSVLYYPHPALWESMGLRVADWSEVNRYQHLIFSVGTFPAGEPPFKVHGQMDFVRVTVDPLRFDFARTGARRVLARAEVAPMLSGNPGLTALGMHDGFVWFAVRANRP